MNLRITKQPTSDQATSLCFVALLTALVILPVFLVDIPAMTDYPNHLARMYLLATIGTPDENPYYIVTWKLYPNLAMDLLVPAMARYIDVAAATKAFLVLSQILVVSGAVALEMTIKRRHQFAGFAAVAVLYSMPFALGFLNFEFGTGMALWGIASWFALENRSLYTRLVCHSVFVFSIFVAHLFALGVYGATIGFYELWRIRSRKFDAKKTVLILTVLIIPTVILLGYTVQSDMPIGNGRAEWGPLYKPLLILSAWSGYGFGLSVFNGVAVFVLLYLLFGFRYLSLMPQGKWIAGGFLILIVALPYRLLGGIYVESRILIPAILIMPAFLVLSPTRQMIGFLPPLVLGVIALLNAGYVATIWLAYRADYSALKSSFALIERGAFVLIGHAPDPPTDFTELPIFHAPVLAIYYAKAFVPSLFTIPGRVLRVRPEIKRLEITDGGLYEPVQFSVLAAIPKARDLAGIPPHLRCWMNDYDYLYLLGPHAPNLMPDRLAALAVDKKFTLYRIKKPSRETIILGNAAHCSKLDTWRR